MSSSKPRFKAPRASVACAKCRSRKVRCDVARRGPPCLNCDLDHEECVVLPNRRTRPAVRRRPSTAFKCPPPRPVSSSSPAEDGSQSPATSSEPANPAQTPEIRRSTTTRPIDIPFQAYGFIKDDFLSRLSQHEICYLDSQSCFRLPVRASWDRLVRIYFRQINPLLPVLDETAFWKQSRGVDCPPTVSLFVAQAVLFAACPFADRRTVSGCGFANCREARAAFYRRAKLLYRLESERHPTSIIQGSLLLSLCSTPQIENPINSLWLSIAIQHARSMGAHRLTPQEETGTATELSHDWLELKRLWWACLVRDRLLALGYRRPLQISEDKLEADLAIISSEEVCGNLAQSEVHPSPVRRALLIVFLAFCRLCIPLTRILRLTDGQELANRGSSLQEAEECVDALRCWLEHANAELEALPPHLRGDDIITLHYHLAQIYFHAAYVRILNLKIMIIVSESAQPGQGSATTTTLLQTGTAIQISVEAIVDSLRTLEQHGLAGYLPITSVMCLILPLILHSMQLNLHPVTPEPPASQKRTQSFVHLIAALQARQNNVHPVTEVTRHILAVIQSGRPMDDWKQFIATQPTIYLRVLEMLDLALSTGRFPVTTAGLGLDGEGGDCRGEAEADRKPVDFRGQVAGDNCGDAEEVVGGTYDDGIGRSLSWSEEEFWALGCDTGMSMSGVESREPVLRDILGLCRDQEFEALLNFI